MQRKDGEAAAAGGTQTELDNLCRQLQRDVGSTAMDHPDAFPLGRVVKSLDNAPAHLKLLRELPTEELNLIRACIRTFKRTLSTPWLPSGAHGAREFTVDTVQAPASRR